MRHGGLVTSQSWEANECRGDFVGRTRSSIKKWATYQFIEMILLDFSYDFANWIFSKAGWEHSIIYRREIRRY